MKKKARFTLDLKMYIFVVGTVLFSVASVCALGFIINVKQIDNYYKHLTEDCAITYAYYVDAELLKEIRVVAESDEYQEIRNHAEEIVEVDVRNKDEEKNQFKRNNTPFKKKEE